MEVLEIEPLKDKKLQVVLVAREYDEKWMFHPTKKSPFKSFSREYCDFVSGVVAKYEPSVVTEELGNRSMKEFMKSDRLVKYMKKNKIMVLPVDIPDAARAYIESTITPKLEVLDTITKEVNSILTKNPERADEQDVQNMIAWGQYLEDEICREEKYVGTTVREGWMVSGILDNARKHNGKKVTCVHICDLQHFEGLTKLFKEVGADVEAIAIEKKVAQPADANYMADVLKPLNITIKPIKGGKGGSEKEYVLYMLDTDEQASPFDINMAIDAGFDHIIPYASMTPDKVTRLVQDMIFSRGHNGVKYTSIFVGGQDMAMADAIVDKIKETMFPPFQASVVVDPRGANTTAAALVAKVIDAMRSVEIGDVIGRKVVVLGGTGPVGSTAAVILAKEGCDVVAVETDSSSDQEMTEINVGRIANANGVTLQARHLGKTTDVKDLIADADVVLSTAKPGVQIVPKSIVNTLAPIKIMADINAVPPAGIEGVEARHDKVEIAPGIYGIGSLAIGALKYNVEMKLLRNARRVGDTGIYDSMAAIEVAKELLGPAKKVTITSNGAIPA